MATSLNLQDQSPKNFRGPKKGEKLAELFVGAATGIKNTIKIVKSLSTMKTQGYNFTGNTFKAFNPAINRQTTMRPFLVTEERLEESVNFDDPEDQKLITDILSIRPKRRLAEEIALLKKAFRDIEFFKRVEKEMDETYFNKIFQALKIEFFKAGQKVFSHGDIGKNFYIIIQGSVYVLLEGSVPSAPEVSSLKYLDIDGDEVSKCRETLGTFLQVEESDELKREMVEKCYPGFWIVQEKVKGDSFGELALNKTGNGMNLFYRLRTATVVCSRDTVCGILAYNDYQSILGALYERKFAENLECLSKVDIFKHWKDNQIASFILSIEVVKFTRNQVIFKDGDKPKYIYFIKKGEVELRKMVSIDIDKEDSWEDVKSPLIARSTTSKPTQWKKKEEMRYLKSQLALLTRGDYFGEGEVIQPKPREYTAITYSGEVELIVIGRDKFMGFVKDKISLQNFEAHIKGKKEWRDNLIKKIVTLRTPSAKQTHLTINTSINLKKDTLKQSLQQLDESPDSPFFCKSSSSSPKKAETKVNSMLLIDEKSPALISTRSINDKNFKFRTPEMSPALKSKKERPAKLMAPGFSFALFKKISESNPVYEKQIQKLKKKFQKEKKASIEIQEIVNLPTDHTGGSSPRKKVAGLIKIRSPNDYEPWNEYGVGSSPVINHENSSRSNSAIVKKKNSIGNEEKMYKMCKSLGLHRVYVEKNMNLVSLDGRPCRSTRISTNLTSDQVKLAISYEKPKRKYSYLRRSQPENVVYPSSMGAIETPDLINPKLIYFGQKGFRLSVNT